MMLKFMKFIADNTDSRSKRFYCEYIQVINSIIDISFSLQQINIKFDLMDLFCSRIEPKYRTITEIIEKVMAVVLFYLSFFFQNYFRMIFGFSLNLKIIFF